MKKFSVILASLVIGLMVASAAQAVTTPPLAEGYNSFYFTNNEVFVNNDGGPANRVDVGDQFWGILDNQDIFKDTTSTGSSGSANWRSDNPTYAPPDEISGYFAMEVKAIHYLKDLNAALPDATVYFYGPTTDPNRILTQANEIMRIFTDPTYDFTSADRASGVSSVTNGDHVWSLGFTYDLPAWIKGGASSADGWFYTIGSGNITTTNLITQGASAVDTYAGYNFLAGSPFTPLLNPICDPADNIFNALVGMADPCVGNIALDYGLLVDIFFNAEITVDQTPNGTGALDNSSFDIFSNDPAVVNAYIPEPATMLLLGTGLVGLAGASRRRRKAAKK